MTDKEDYKKNKEEYRKIVEDIKNKAKDQGKTLKVEDIASILGYERSYFSTLTGERGKVTEDHIKHIHLHFRHLLDNTTQPNTAPITEPPPIDYQKEYMALHKEHNALLKEHGEIKEALLEGLQSIIRRIDDIDEHIRQFRDSHKAMKAELNKLQHSGQVNLAIQSAFQDHWLHYFYKDQKKVAQMKKNIELRMIEYLAKMKKGSIDKAVGIAHEEGNERNKS